MKVCLYARVATKEQLSPSGINLAIQRQIDKMNKYAEENNYSVVDLKFDVGSGMDYTRKSLREMIAIPTSNCDGVLVCDVSRIGRNPVKTMNWIKMLEKSNKKLITVDYGIVDSQKLF